MSCVRVELAGQGVLEGQTVKTKSGFLYKSFSGIPYAKPPLGDLRFKDPVPSDKWEGVLDATKEVKICSQFDAFIKKAYTGEEDCLYLNVYAPDSAKKGDKLPVMFWVHGGGYTSGSGSPDLYGPDYLVPHNVILVTINYRLGALGFLCLDMEGAAGNMGLKDQALALRWVNKHIATFGGDPDNVTLFGESAGGSAVHNLVMGIPTQGMFHKAIFQSGVSICEWSIPHEPSKAAFILGEALGCKTKDKKELLEYLKKVPVEKLSMVAASPTLIDDLRLSFGPVAEKSIPNVSPFMTEDVRSRMERGDFPKLPIMAGCTSNEGFLMLLVKAEQFGLGKNENIDVATAVPDFKNLVPKHLQAKFDDKNKEIAAQKIKEYYFPENRNVFKSYELFQNDYSFIKDIDLVVKKFSQSCPTYFYNFSYKGTLNLIELLFPFPYEGACHADELGYLFAPNFDKMKEIIGKEVLHKVQDVTEKDVLVIKRMSEMWTNFAKYGDPTPKMTENLTTKWKPVTGGVMNCLDIGESLALVNNPYKERVQFWESLEKL